MLGAPLVGEVDGSLGGEVAVAEQLEVVCGAHLVRVRASGRIGARARDRVGIGVGVRVRARVRVGVRRAPPPHARRGRPPCTRRR